MAYIVQQRRDTLENWAKVNPVLADAEIGFILDLGEIWVDDVREVWVQAKDNEGNLLFDNEGNPIKVQKFDEDGKPMLEQILDEEGNPIKVKKIIQKSSFYKIGNGTDAWNDLPMFGFGGNFYDSFEGDDLEASVASRRAILEKFANIVEGTEETEGLLNKLSNTQLVQSLGLKEGEVLDEAQLQQQIVSRLTLLNEFQIIWDKFIDIDTNHIELIESDIEKLQEFATTFGEFKEAAEEDILQIQTDLEECRKYVFGWDEAVESEEGEEPTTVHHKGIGEVLDEKIAEVNDSIETLNQNIENKLQIMHQTQFDNIDFSSPEVLELFDEGTIFFTYTDNEEEN